MEILLSLFLTAGLCLGLPMVVWTLFYLRRHKDGGGTVSAFIASLLFSDIVEIVLTPFVNTRFLDDSPCHSRLPCWLLYRAFAEVRLCGLHSHQLVALDGILSLIYPRSTNCCGTVWSITITLFLWIMVMSCNFFSFGYISNLMACVVPVTLAIMTTVFTIGHSLTSSDPCKHNGPHLSMLAMALVTFLLYVPCLVLSWVNDPDPFYVSPWATTVVSIMSLRLVTEPLLCVLVCRESLKCQTSQRHRQTTSNEAQGSN